MNKDENGARVLLVDDRDRPQGEMDKMEAHRKGNLHRAFSVLLFDREGRLLLQRRAMGKYHSEGLWTNTCCSHPAPNELIMAAAYRRLQEEMGIRASLRPMFTTRYYLEVGDGMIENEMDHVLFGISDQEPKLNELEVMDQRYVHQDRLEEELREHPEQFTEWFKVIWSEYVELKGEKIGEGQ